MALVKYLAISHVLAMKEGMNYYHQDQVILSFKKLLTVSVHGLSSNTCPKVFRNKNTVNYYEFFLQII